MVLVIASGSAVLGAGTLHTGEPPSPEVLPPVMLPPVAAKPSPEVVARRMAENARDEEIARASDWYGIDRELAERIHDAARAEGVPTRLAFGLVRVESRFDSTAVSSAGALGLTQVMPATARGVEPEVERDELFRADTNLRIGMRYLRGLLDRYDDREIALTAYNRGPGTVARARAAGEDPHNGYAEMVLESRVPRAGSGR